MPASRWNQHLRNAGAVTVTLLVLGCANDESSHPLAPGMPKLATAANPPAGLVSLTVAGASHSIWPYTGVDFSGTPQDPINLVIAGKSDPRLVRAALLALNGDRTAFGMPNVFPFNCTWSDAIGDLQTGYNATAGWTGSAIQLACGGFGPVRFHIRLFEAGVLTLGNVHFEVLIPGTTEHQVLSWELAEQLVLVDFVRSGLLGAAPGSSGIINAAPSFREIADQIYNALPNDLKLTIGGPTGPVSSPVPIATDGQASVFQLEGEISPAPGSSTQMFVVEWGQVIPRPFCAEGPEDFVLVEGPVNLRKTVEVLTSGELQSEFVASGQLRLTPIDPQTGSPIGVQYRANVEDRQITSFGAAGGAVDGLVRQMELPQNVDGRGNKTVKLTVGPAGLDFDEDIRCKR